MDDWALALTGIAVAAPWAVLLVLGAVAVVGRLMTLRRRRTR